MGDTYSNILTVSRIYIILKYIRNRLKGMMHMLINVHELNFGATIATGAVVELVSHVFDGNAWFESDR